MPNIVLDITRTIKRSAHTAPTGIDRVERAYFEWALSQSRGDLAFLCRIWGGQALISRAVGERIFEETAFRPVTSSEFIETPHRRRIQRRYNEAVAFRRSERWFRSAEAGRRAFARLGIEPEASIYLNVSHNNLEPGSLRLLRELGVGRIAALIHDVIPVDYPEFVVDGVAPKFERKLAELAKYVDGLIFNSRYTAERTMAWIERFTDRPIAQMVGHLGIGDLWSAPYQGPEMSPHPYFVTLGTIEPRKNHLMLLNLWRRLTAEMAEPPHLRVIGWRGWENENIIDVLDRAPMMGQTVFEHPSDSDDRVRAWMAGARAVLYPSFVEGFGLPIVESLVAGVPVICSDLPVLREVGQGVPEYVDPLDGPGWGRLVRAYADPEDPARMAQLRRIERFAPPTWSGHLDGLNAFIDELAPPSGPGACG